MTYHYLNRRAAEIQASCLYRYHAPYGPDVCVYCGDPAQSLDHVTPIAHIACLIGLVDVREKFRHGLFRVPACKDCNSRLGATMATCITEKRTILKQRLRSRHRKLLASYDWTPDEVGELGHTLQTHIRRQEAIRARILRRLAFPQPWETLVLRQRA